MHRRQYIIMAERGFHDFRERERLMSTKGIATRFRFTLILLSLISSGSGWASAWVFPERGVGGKQEYFKLRVESDIKRDER